MTNIDYIGVIVAWEGEEWYVDNTDENFKDDGEETSLFLLPKKYADADEYDKIFKSGEIDRIGYWVHESEVTAIND